MKFVKFSWFFFWPLEIYKTNCMLLFTVKGFALITALRQQLTAVVCTGYCIFRDSNVQLTKIFTSAVWRRVRLCLWFRGEWACREYGERKNRKWRRRTIGNETQKGERGRQRKRDREARFTFVVSTHRGWWLHFFLSLHVFLVLFLGVLAVLITLMSQLLVCLRWVHCGSLITVIAHSFSCFPSFGFIFLLSRIGRRQMCALTMGREVEAQQRECVRGVGSLRKSSGNL